MRSGIARASALLSVALILGGCADPPLSPDEERASLSAQPSLAAPSNLTTAVSPSQVNLAWKDNSTNESGFQIYRSVTGAEGTFTDVAGAGPDATGHSDRELTSEKEYCYKIRSFRTSGRKTTYTTFSNTACTTTPGTSPLAPNVHVRPLWSDGVIVRWSDNADNEDGYRVQRSAQNTGPWVTVVTRGPMIGVNSQEASDVGLTAELQVCYRVVAFNSTGESASEIRCTVPPAQPTNLVAKPFPDLSVELTWTDNSAFEDGYQVLRMRSGLPGTLSRPCRRTPAVITRPD